MYVHELEDIDDQFKALATEEKWTSSYHVVVTVYAGEGKEEEDLLEVHVPMKMFWEAERTTTAIGKSPEYNIKYEQEVDTVAKFRKKKPVVMRADRVLRDALGEAVAEAGAKDERLEGYLQEAGAEAQSPEAQGPEVHIKSIRISKESLDAGEKGYTWSVLKGNENAIANDEVPATLNSGPVFIMPEPQDSPPKYFRELRRFLEPDFTIYLKSEDTPPKLVTTFKVNRFMLGFRIPYFKTFFESDFEDANGIHSTLYTDSFSKESLLVVLRYIYLLTESRVRNFWYISDETSDIDPSIVFNRYMKCQCRVEVLKRALEPYDASDKPNKVDVRKYMHPVKLIAQIKDVINAAEYLAMDDLKECMYTVLYTLAHGFQCSKSSLGLSPEIGCHYIIPLILDALYYPQNPPYIFDEALRHMANNIEQWKRPMLNMKPEILLLIVEKVKSRFNTRNLPSNEVAKVFTAMRDLHEKTLQSSETAEKWSDFLLPQLRFLAEEVTLDLKAAIFPAREDVDAEKLLGFIVAECLTRESCMRVYVDLSQVKKEYKNEFEGCVAWFKRNWLSLSVAEAYWPTGVPGMGAEGTYLGMSRNFFGNWKKEVLGELSEMLGVEVGDLLAVGSVVERTRTGLVPAKGWGRGGGGRGGRGSRWGRGNGVGSVGWG